MTLATEQRDGAALAFAMLFPGVMAWLYFVQLAGAEARANPALQFAFGAGKVIQFTFPAVYVWWFERHRLVLRPPARRGLELGFGFGAATAAAILALYYFWLKHSPLLGDAPDRIFRKVQEFGLATPLGYLKLGLFICVVHSLFEEYYWRWFVFGTLKRYLHVAAAIALASLGFMVHHIVILGVYFPDRFWTLAIPFSICVGIGGGIWSWIYHRTGSLYATWLSHTLIDAAVLLVGYDMLSPHWVPILFDGNTLTPVQP
jgi:membrane protease YdiL (CAAX protease family)